MPPLCLQAEQSMRCSVLLTPYPPDVRVIECLIAVSVSSARASEGRQPLQHSSSLQQAVLGRMQ